MSLAEKIIIDLDELSEDGKREVIDFIGFLKQKEKQEIENLMKRGILENLDALKELAK